MAEEDVTDDSFGVPDNSSDNSEPWKWGDQWEGLSITSQEMRKASSEGEVETLRSLLNDCSDASQMVLEVDIWGVTPLHYALNIDIAQLLVETVEPNKLREFLSVTGYYFRWTALDSAVANHRIDVAEYLCGLTSADESLLDGNFLFACQHLCKAQSVHMAKILVESVPLSMLTALLLHTDENEQTALHVAASWGVDEVVNYLCGLSTTQLVSADLLHMKDKWGRTALHLARTGGIARMLIKTARDKTTYINITNNEGNTAAMRMTERGRIEALEYTLHCIHGMLGDCGIRSALLTTNNKKQNMLHLACISPMIEDFYAVLEDYLCCVKVEELFTADIFENTPFTYLVARYSTTMFAQLILKFPLWQRRILLLWKNRMQTNCLAISMQQLFQSDFYMKKVLCRRDSSSYTSMFHDTCHLHNPDKFERDHLALPQKYIRYDVDLFRVMKYALNEYSLVDQPMISTHSQMFALAASIQRDGPKFLVFSHMLLQTVVIAQSTLKFSHFDSDELALDDIQKMLYALDETEKQSKPKVVVVTCTKCDQVRYVSPPGPDFIIISAVTAHSTSNMFANLQNMTFGDIEELLGYLKRQDIVKYININSTMSKHYGRFRETPAKDHVLLSGAKKGKALIICNREQREKWDIEYSHADHLMKQLGLQVECLHGKSADGMLAAISEFSKSSGHGSLTALSIMSHGDLRDSICGDGTCGGECSVQQVVNAFCLPNIQSVTKLLFLSYCRGHLSHRNNRTNASWECTTLRDTALLTKFSPIRYCVPQELLDQARKKPFPSVDVPVNCYICYSTLPDTKSFRYSDSDGSANKMFDSMSDHLNVINRCCNLYRRGVDSTADCVVQDEVITPEMDTPSSNQVVAPSAQQQLPRVELLPLLIDVTAIAREKSQFTQYLNYCYAITKDSKPVVVEILPVEVSRH